MRMMRHETISGVYSSLSGNTKLFLHDRKQLKYLWDTADDYNQEKTKAQHISLHWFKTLIT